METDDSLCCVLKSAGGDDWVYLHTVNVVSSSLITMRDESHHCGDISK